MSELKADEATTDSTQQNLIAEPCDAVATVPAPANENATDAKPTTSEVCEESSKPTAATDEVDAVHTDSATNVNLESEEAQKPDADAPKTYERLSEPNTESGDVTNTDAPQQASINQTDEIPRMSETSAEVEKQSLETIAPAVKAIQSETPAAAVNPAAGEGQAHDASFDQSLLDMSSDRNEESSENDRSKHSDLEQRVQSLQRMIYTEPPQKTELEVRHTTQQYH